MRLGDIAKLAFTSDEYALSLFGAQQGVFGVNEAQRGHVRDRPQLPPSAGSLCGAPNSSHLRKTIVDARGDHPRATLSA